MTDRKALTDTDTAALQPLAKATTACGTLDGLKVRVGTKQRSQKNQRRRVDERSEIHQTHRWSSLPSSILHSPRSSCFCIVPKGNWTRSSSHRNRGGKDQTVEVGLAEGRGTLTPGSALEALASRGDRPATARGLEPAQTCGVFERALWRGLKRLAVAGATAAALDR